MATRVRRNSSISSMSCNTTTTKVNNWDLSASKIPIFVDCSGRRLSGSELPPWSISYPANVNHDHVIVDLDLSDNKMNSVEVFPPMPVQSISFRNNKILRIADRSFQNLTFFTYLDLSRNHLTADALTEEVFYGRYHGNQDYDPLPLLELDLSHNSLSTLQRTAFVHLTNLEVLDLSGNPIEEVDTNFATALASLNSLTKLTLSHTSLRQLPDNFLIGLSSLRYLDISFNQFATMPADMRYIKSLAELNISGNRFVTFDSDTFEDLKALESLYAEHMGTLNSIGDSSLGTMPMLKTISLRNNSRLSFIHADAFDPLHAESFALRELFLSGCELNYLPEDLLPGSQNWDDMEVIDIEDNPWACDCHNEWMLGELLDQIIDDTPHLASDLKCGGRDGLRGRQFTDLRGKHITDVPNDRVLPCNQHDDFNPRSPDYGVVNGLITRAEARLAPTRHSSPSSASSSTSSNSHLAVGVAIMCILTVVATVVFVSGLYFQRKRAAQYRAMQHPVRYQPGQTAHPFDDVVDDGGHGNIVRR